MYPFYVLGVSEGATDAEVDARYRALLERFPPDREPERFRLLRAAFEALRTERGRRSARLFAFDEGGRALTEDLPRWLDGQRRRASPEALATWLREEPT